MIPHAVHKWVARWESFAKRDYLGLTFKLVLTAVLIGAAGLFIFERDGVLHGTWYQKLWNALWWSMVTMATVGYGDIAPVSFGGRLVAILLMMFGIGFLGVFTATIASIFVEYKLKEGTGMEPARFRDHIVICGWKEAVTSMIAQVHDPHIENPKPIVVIADLDNKSTIIEALQNSQAVDNEHILEHKIAFVKGDPSKAEVLARANVAEAAAVIVLADNQAQEKGEKYADLQTVVTALAIGKLCTEAGRNVYTLAEVMDAENIRHLRSAGVDEVVDHTNFNGSLLARSALYHGFSSVVSSLITPGKGGNELYKVRAHEIPGDLKGKTLGELSQLLKAEHGAILLAVEQADKDAAQHDNVILNPETSYVLRDQDNLIVVAPNVPVLA